jgi:hypothetical protein
MKEPPAGASWYNDLVSVMPPRAQLVVEINHALQLVKAITAMGQWVGGAAIRPSLVSAVVDSLVAAMAFGDGPFFEVRVRERRAVFPSACMIYLVWYASTLTPLLRPLSHVSWRSGGTSFGFMKPIRATRTSTFTSASLSKTRAWPFPRPRPRPPRAMWSISR